MSPIDWERKAREILEKIRSYREEKDGWKVVKSSSDVTVWERPSPDWNGTLYKVEGEVCGAPEAVFAHIDPSPTSTRGRWDKAIKELQIIEKMTDDISVVRTTTHSAFGGLIGSRDFIDLVVNERTADYIATNASNVDHPSCPASSDYIRGRNYYCSICCHKVPSDPKKTLVQSFIQTDLGGRLPKPLVENALPSNQINFFNSLRAAISDSGLTNGNSDQIH